MAIPPAASSSASAWPPCDGSSDVALAAVAVAPTCKLPEPLWRHVLAFVAAGATREFLLLLSTVEGQDEEEEGSEEGEEGGSCEVVQQQKHNSVLVSSRRRKHNRKNAVFEVSRVCRQWSQWLRGARTSFVLFKLGAADLLGGLWGLALLEREVNNMGEKEERRVMKNSIQFAVDRYGYPYAERAASFSSAKSAAAAVAASARAGAGSDFKHAQGLSVATLRTETVLRCVREWLVADHKAPDGVALTTLSDEKASSARSSDSDREEGDDNSPTERSGHAAFADWCEERLDAAREQLVDRQLVRHDLTILERCSAVAAEALGQTDVRPVAQRGIVWATGNPLESSSTGVDHVGLVREKLWRLADHQRSAEAALVAMEPQHRHTFRILVSFLVASVRTNIAAQSTMETAALLELLWLYLPLVIVHGDTLDANISNDDEDLGAASVDLTTREVCATACATVCGYISSLGAGLAYDMSTELVVTATRVFSAAVAVVSASDAARLVRKLRTDLLRLVLNGAAPLRRGAFRSLFELCANLISFGRDEFESEMLSLLASLREIVTDATAKVGFFETAQLWFLVDGLLSPRRISVTGSSDSSISSNEGDFCDPPLARSGLPDPIATLMVRLSEALDLSAFDRASALLEPDSDSVSDSCDGTVDSGSGVELPTISEDADFSGNEKRVTRRGARRKSKHRRGLPPPLLVPCVRALRWMMEQCKRDSGDDEDDLFEELQEDIIETLVSKLQKYTELTSDRMTVLNHDENRTAYRFAAVEVIHAIEVFGTFDNRLVDALDASLRIDSMEKNSPGIVEMRDASVNALQALGVPPNGRGCLEVFWADECLRGKSKKARVLGLLTTCGFFTFFVLFFLLLFPDITSRLRSIETVGSIVDIENQASRSCELCIEQLISINYTYHDEVRDEERYHLGKTRFVCRNLNGNDTTCEKCCARFQTGMADVDCLYDPNDLDTVYLFRHERTTDAWPALVLFTVFYPALPLLIVISALFRWSGRAFVRSNLERGRGEFGCAA